MWARYERRHGPQAAFACRRESADLRGLAARARAAFAWLAARPEREMVVVAHIYIHIYIHMREMAVVTHLHAHTLAHTHTVHM